MYKEFSVVSVGELIMMVEDDFKEWVQVLKTKIMPCTLRTKVSRRSTALNFLPIAHYWCMWID